MDAIVTYDLTKEYEGKLALEGLNLQVPQGTAFACVGEPGCGKTTLARLLAGLCRPTAGECTVLGMSPTYEPQRLHGAMGAVLPSTHMYRDMTLWENLHFFAGLHGLDDNDALERSSLLLHKLDIWESRDLWVDRLPTGVLRRASLARALMHSPKVLVMDEPAGGLDQETADGIRELLSWEVEQEGMTLFLCTAHMGYAQLTCDHFAILRKGVLLAKGGLETLRKSAGLGYRAQLRAPGADLSSLGFHRKDDTWEKEIVHQEAMPRIIAQVVGDGIPLYEARLLSPTLGEIYQAYLEGGRRKVQELDETGEESPADGTIPEPEEAGGEDAGEKTGCGEDGFPAFGEFSGEADFSGEETGQV